MAETAQNSSNLAPSVSPPQIKGKARISGFQPTSGTPSAATTASRDVRRPWGSTDAATTPTSSSSPPAYPALGKIVPSQTPLLSSGIGALTPGGIASSRPNVPASAPRDVTTPRRPSENPATASVQPPRTPSGGQLGPTIIPSRLTLAEGSANRRHVT